MIWIQTSRSLHSHRADQGVILVPKQARENAYVISHQLFNKGDSTWVEGREFSVWRLSFSAKKEVDMDPETNLEKDLRGLYDHLFDVLVEHYENDDDDPDPVFRSLKHCLDTLAPILLAATKE